MDFSVSTFAVEVNGTTCAVFQAKWHSEADAIGQGWVEDQLQRLSAAEDPGLPPLIRIRVARPTERAAYGAQDNAEFYAGVEFVAIKDVRSALAR